jgi:hypothetical protein
MTQTSSGGAAAAAERYAGFEYAIQSDGVSSLAERMWSEQQQQSSSSSSAGGSRQYIFHTVAGGRPNRGRSSGGASVTTSLAQVRREVERAAGAYERGEKLPDRPPPTPQAPPPPRQPQQQQMAAAADLAPPVATGSAGGRPTSAGGAIATSNSSSAARTSPRNPYSSSGRGGGGVGASSSNANAGGIGGGVGGAEGNMRHKEDRDRCRALLLGSSAGGGSSGTTSANAGGRGGGPKSNDDGVIEIGDDDEYDPAPVQFDYGGGDAGSGFSTGNAPAGDISASASRQTAPPPTFAPSTLNWHTDSTDQGGCGGAGVGTADGGGKDTFDDDIFASLDVDAIVSQHQAKKQMQHQPPSQSYPNQGGGYQSQGYSAGGGGGGDGNYNGSSANPYSSSAYRGSSGYGNGGGTNSNTSSYGGGGRGFDDDFGATGHMNLYGGGGSSGNNNGGYQQSGGGYANDGGGYANDGYGDYGGSLSGWGNSAAVDSYGSGSSSWGGATSNMSSAGGNGSAPLCSGHGAPCRLLTASTAQNSGRQFYKCSLPEGEQCDHFEWADGMEGSLNPAADVQGAEIKDMHTESRRKFGHHSFRLGQEGIIRNALQGRDVFVLMPTGGGKSLCYQLPAWCAPGLSVVVSPLLSLIQDQVQSMTKLGVESVFLSSAQDWETQRSQVVARIRNVTPHGGVKLLYITPEMLNRSGMMKGILSNLCKKKLISRFVVDEGECNCYLGC